MLNVAWLPLGQLFDTSPPLGCTVTWRQKAMKANVTLTGHVSEAKGVEVIMKEGG